MNNVTAKYVNGRELFARHKNELLHKMEVIQVPTLENGRFTVTALTRFLPQSRLSNQQAEGLYLRFDQDERPAQRAKLVHPAFVQSLSQRWSYSGIRPNQLSSEVCR